MKRLEDIKKEMMAQNAVVNNSENIKGGGMSWCGDKRPSLTITACGLTLSIML